MTKARELTAMRLLTVHNLAFVARVMERLRAAVLAGDLATVAAELRAGEAP
jgi:queuine tRNA-ribosyltransferase